MGPMPIAQNFAVTGGYRCKAVPRPSAGGRSNWPEPDIAVAIGPHAAGFVYRLYDSVDDIVGRYCLLARARIVWLFRVVGWRKSIDFSD